MNERNNEPQDATGGDEPGASNFIRAIIDDDLASGKHSSVVTRFPPHPNGLLHIGHVKAISINFGIARDYAGGRCHLRFDDTNPTAEETQYVDAMQDDIRWLGFDWDGNLYYASDYFGKLFEFACDLIRAGKAYVCDLGSEDHARLRGTLTEPGQPSPYRDRSAAENLDLFERMQQGEFEPGARVLRAKIDMASPVLTMRDPILYRILDAKHHRTGSEWSIYPMYDFAHCLSDALEGITHSLCSLEFVDHRPLYDWILEQVDVPCHPQQIEFARLNLSHTIVSKRALRRLVEEGHVSGWDDPRMPTLAGLRRRGYRPESIRRFVEAVGVARRENTIELARLEFEVRQDLNKLAPRRMGVLEPLKVVIENYPEGESEMFDAANHPQDPAMGSRKLSFGRTIYIERADFMEDPPKKFFRLGPDREVRLRYAYLVTCTEVIKDAAGEVVELRCRYDPQTRGGDAPDGRKVKGTLHWVSAEHAIDAEVRLYDTLFSAEDPSSVDAGEDFMSNLNPASLRVLSAAKLEPSLADAEVGSTVQFERQGYFTLDADSGPDALVFNRTVTLRDTWAKVKGGPSKP